MSFDLHAAHLFWTPQLRFMSKITSVTKRFEFWQFLRDLHVDDATASCNSSSEALEFYSVCKQNLLKGGFQLRKWESNNINLQKNISEKETDNSNSSSNPSTDDTTYAQYQLGLNDPQFWKVLGMKWDIVRDKFQFSFEKYVNLSWSYHLQIEMFWEFLLCFPIDWESYRLWYCKHTCYLKIFATTN